MHLDCVAVFLADGLLFRLPFLFQCEPIPMEWTRLGSATMQEVKLRLNEVSGGMDGQFTLGDHSAPLM